MASRVTCLRNSARRKKSVLLALTNEGVSCLNRCLLAAVCGAEFHATASFSLVLTHVSASPCTLLLLRLWRDEADANPLTSVTIFQAFYFVIKRTHGYYSGDYIYTVTPITGKWPHFRHHWTQNINNQGFFPPDVLHYCSTITSPGIGLAWLEVNLLETNLKSNYRCLKQINKLNNFHALRRIRTCNKESNCHSERCARNLQ